MSNQIHPSAIIAEEVILGNNVNIGPFCVVGKGVSLGDNVQLKSHVVIEGNTIIGDNTIIYPFASLGQAPQDLKYKGENSILRIGKNNIIREYVTMQCGTKGGGMVTSVGDNCLFMVGVHIAHDCVVGNNVIFANYASLAGHVKVDDYTRIGGLAAVAQHVKIGKYTMIGGLSGINRDVIPFGLAQNERANLEGLNLIGMTRLGIDKKYSLEASKAIKEIFTAGEVNFSEKLKNIINKYPDNPVIKQIYDFIASDDTRSFCQFKK